MTKKKETEKEIIELALMEAIYISRWNDDKTALCAVLTPDEVEQMVNNIFSELGHVGYEIRKKNEDI